MSNTVNPFHDLYLTEAISSEKFVQLFSPEFVKHGFALYQPSNVILKGLQGSGKTMLLNLLKPDIRLAYAKAGIEFPVPKEHSRFISAGINFRKSGISEFAQVISDDASHKDIQELALHFGDFFNYWIVFDLLHSIDFLLEGASEELLTQIGVRKSDLDSFAEELAQNPCWSGALSDSPNYSNLKDRISQRISTYRKYINFNLPSLPTEITTTKTVIGDPISVAVDCLKKFQIIDDDVSVFVRIDQYEELTTLDFSGFNFGGLCQQLIHKALSARDSRISYRIGTRHYSWPKKPIIFATEGALENRRDFSVVDIDEMLRRTENRAWIFPHLCEDIFKRRLRFCKKTIDHDSEESSLLKHVFGKTPPAEEKAKLLVPSNTSRSRIIRGSSRWPEEWTQFLSEYALKNPLSAKFGQAWVLQKGKGKQEYINAEHDINNLPWMAANKQYWRKERSEQALTQIASLNAQQLHWFGAEDILGLSGSNILIYLFICQHIWDSWLRYNRGKDSGDNCLPQIDYKWQSLGVLNASEEWLKKPFEGKDSSRRKAMTMLLGKRYYRHLTNDLAMSYPGWTGFSLDVDELDRDENAVKFLESAVSFGDLYESPHTSKIKGQKRKKYYLAPIFCPAFRITYKHIKEPEYISLEDFTEWLNDVSNHGKLYKTSLYNLDEDTSPQGSLF